MAVRDIKLSTLWSKNIYLSRDFLAFLEVKVLGKVLIYILVSSVQIIRRPDGQSKFQMFTLFSGRHVGVPRRYTNVPAPYWAVGLKLGEVSALSVSYKITIS